MKKTGRRISKAVSQRLKICATDIRIVKILGKTIDTSDKEQFYREFSIVVSVPDGFDNKENLPVYSEKIKADKNRKNSVERPIIIGFGPAGMFAALELISMG